MNPFLRFLAKQIVIDVDPSRFVFSCSREHVSLSVAPFLYIDDSKPDSVSRTRGDKEPNDRGAGADVYRVDPFDRAKPLPPNRRFDRVDLIQLIFEYGMGRIFEKHFLPILRPTLVIKGSNRFTGVLSDPQAVFGVAAKRAGAGEVVFHTIDL